MRIVTHNGHFHADELLAVAALLIKYPDAEIVRSRDEEVIKTGDIVVDVGQVYDQDLLRFDHHQNGGAGERENGIPYASFGLVWKKFGEELAGGTEQAAVIDRKLAVPVDAEDNGVNTHTPIFEGVKLYSLGDFFDSFALEMETLEDYEKGFFEALPVAASLLKREINSAKHSVSDWQEVEKIYNQTEDKRIIILPSSMHWRQVLIDKETLFVVSPRQDGNWGVVTVPTEPGSFNRKKSLPASWAGLSGQDLALASGVPDAVFCHRGLWLANARSKEGAIKLAEIALNS